MTRKGERAKGKTEAKPRIVKTTVELDFELWRALKIRALDADKDFRTIVTEGLWHYLRTVNVDGTPILGRNK